jgi:ferredoxin--NADP+ reductase
VAPMTEAESRPPEATGGGERAVLEGNRPPDQRGAPHRVVGVAELEAGVFILRLERNGLRFRAGQYIAVGPAGGLGRREYTVYSPPQEERFLELLIKEIEGGDVSPQLRRCRPGDEVRVAGPFGSFTLPQDPGAAPFLFVATGTGIAPFHAMVQSRPHLDYQVLHGVRRAGQLYGREAFDPQRHVGCLSRGERGGFSGRVTEYLGRRPPDPRSRCYLCGCSDMIYEAFSLLRSMGIPRCQLFTEVYY